jgi:tetratricopeptide (TPR) repeat protein
MILVPIDRPAILRNAETLLRGGKIDQAIAEYLRIVEEQPSDWNTANVLGDVYVRAGQTDRAVEQFARIADHLHAEGFLPKAAAVYKKILKLRPDHEHAMLQAGEIAGRQGLAADARSLFNAIAERRRARGDERGVAEISVRLATLDPNDFGARMAGARTRVALGDVAGAIADLKALAAYLHEKDRQEEARQALEEAAALDPQDPELRTQQSGGDPRLLLAAAEAQLRGGQVDDALAALGSLLEQHPDVREGVVILGGEARAIAEDLVVREPWERANIERFRRALVLMGEPDPDEIIARRLSGESPFASGDPMPSVELERRDAFEAPTATFNLDQVLEEVAVAPASRPRVTHAEVDLSVALAEMNRSSQAPETAAPVPRDLVSRQPGEENYRQGLALYEAGRVDEAVPLLESAWTAPGLRFATSSMLGRIFLDRGAARQAIEWFERAAQAPAPTPEEGHALLFDLAEALEGEGETARALAICMELQADAGNYRDVAARIDRLATVRARG